MDYNWLYCQPLLSKEAHPTIVFFGILRVAIALKREKFGGGITILAGILHLLEEIYLWVCNNEIPRLVTFLFSDELSYSHQYYLIPYVVVLLIVIPGIAK